MICCIGTIWSTTSLFGVPVDIRKIEVANVAQMIVISVLIGAYEFRKAVVVGILRAGASIYGC